MIDPADELVKALGLLVQWSHIAERILDPGKDRRIVSGDWMDLCGLEALTVKFVKEFTV